MSARPRCLDCNAPISYYARRCDKCFRKAYGRKPSAVAPTALALQKQHPDWTWQRIATEVGVTRERVRQVMAKAGIPNPSLALSLLNEPKCQKCGLGVLRRHTKLCPECRYEDVEVYDLVCSECGKTFERKAWLQDRQDRINPHHGTIVFCGRPCQGKYLAKHSGFIAHPENMRYQRKTSCLRGHPLVEPNLYFGRGKYGRTERHCKTCALERSKAQTSARKALSAT